MTKGVESGFTLIEVLVAATILFLVSATTLAAYQTTLQSNARAAALLQVLKVIEPSRMHITKAIQDQINDGNIAELEGAFHVLGLNVHWYGAVSDASPPPPLEDIDAAQYIRYEDRFYLIDVKMNIEHQDISRSYQFREVAWANRAEQI